MDDELARLAKSLRQRERLQRRAAHLRAAVTEASVRLRQARARSVAEQQALQRRAGSPTARLLAAARGARNKILLRKHADARTAQYRLRQAREDLAVLRKQLDQTVAGLAATSDVPAAYTAALTRKEGRLRSSGEGPGPRLDELAHLHERLQAELRDLLDIVSLADTAAAALEQTAEALDCTAGWSVADILGGGPLISMIKDEELDDALDLAGQADHHLSALRRRLGGMPLSATAEWLSVDVVTRFADISLDNILVDASVHHQITVAQDQVDHALGHVCDVRAKLTDRITAAQAELLRATAERHALLRR